MAAHAGVVRFLLAIGIPRTMASRWGLQQALRGGLRLPGLAEGWLNVGEWWSMASVCMGSASTTAEGVLSLLSCQAVACPLSDWLQK